MPPTRVIIVRAKVTSLGVQIDWLPAQAGTYKIGGYIIERNHRTMSFEQIGRVENGSRNFIDSGGQPGDAYRIIAEDEQKPAHHAIASEQTVAVMPKAGELITVAPADVAQATRNVLDASTDHPSSPDMRAATLQHHIVEIFSQFDTAVARHDFTETPRTLNRLQDYYRQILFIFRQLSPAQQLSLRLTCQQQAGPLEADLALLPENYQMDGLLVKAECEAIQDAAE